MLHSIWESALILSGSRPLISKLKNFQNENKNYDMREFFSKGNETESTKFDEKLLNCALAKLAISVIFMHQRFCPFCAPFLANSIVRLPNSALLLVFPLLNERRKCPFTHFNYPIVISNLTNFTSQKLPI